MRSRLLIVAGLGTFGLVGALLTLNRVSAQPPKTLPPDLRSPIPNVPPGKGVVPASGIKPPAVATPTRKPAPFDRFRKYDQLPELTREIVLSAQGGMAWLSRDGIHQSSGRFIPGLNPALGKATDDDNFIRQAFGALALARSAKLTGDEKFAVHAGQAILSLLAETPKDDSGMRKPVQSSVVCNRVGSAAYLAMAIYEFPDAAPELRQCGEELCQYLKAQLKADGSVQCSEGGSASKGDGSDVYAGPALAALSMSQRTAPAAWKKEALARGCAYYRKQFKAMPSSEMLPWLIAAFADMHLQTKEPAYAEFVFEMSDWAAKLQYEGTDRLHVDWRGGFPTIVNGKIVASAPTVDAAYFAMGLSDACRMLRQMEQPDAARYDRYRAVLTRALQFLTTLQYGEQNTVHFAGHFRPVLVGAFHPSMTDGNLRIDQTAAAVCAMTQFLIAGADR